MSKRDSDLTLVRQAVLSAQIRSEQTMRIHFEVFETVNELAPLVTSEQMAAFNAMDHRIEGHPRRVTVKVDDVDALLP